MCMEVPHEHNLKSFFLNFFACFLPAPERVEVDQCGDQESSSGLQTTESRLQTKSTVLNDRKELGNIMTGIVSM